MPYPPQGSLLGHFCMHFLCHPYHPQAIRSHSACHQQQVPQVQVSTAVQTVAVVLVATEWHQACMGVIRCHLDPMHSFPLLSIHPFLDLVHSQIRCRACIEDRVVVRGNHRHSVCHHSAYHLVAKSPTQDQVVHQQHGFPMNLQKFSSHPHRVDMLKHTPSTVECKVPEHHSKQAQPVPDHCTWRVLVLNQLGSRCSKTRTLVPEILGGDPAQPCLIKDQI